MSLFRQIWLAVIVTTLVAFTGSFVLGLLSARNYLETQLAIKNADNAEALALSISQQPNKDKVTQELLVAAQFDTGHYESIRLADPFGKPVVERSGKTTVGDVPGWFVELFPIRSAPGQALVSSGWQQIGTIQVVSHASFAYRDLWRNSIQLFVWFALAGGVTGLLATLALRRLQRPLASVVSQAEAIGERRFVSIPKPGVPELDSLAGAMNAMVARLKTTFDEQTARIDELRQRANHDALTGLANRAYFENRLQATLSNEEAAPDGTLLLLRVPGLAELNTRLGRKSADALLVSVARSLEVAGRSYLDAFAARLNGADFALLLPGVADGRAAAARILTELRELAEFRDSVDTIAQIGIGHFSHGMSVGAVLARTDRALAAAEAAGGNNWQNASDEYSAFQPTSSADWVHQIRGAIDARRLKLAAYPVCRMDGSLMHEEVMLRMRINEDGEWLPAGQILPMATRVRITDSLDLAALDLALERLQESTDGSNIAVNVSAESIEDQAFRAKLLQRLRAARSNRRLSIEVPESGALRHFAAVRALREALSGTQCGLGIEHVGRRFGDFVNMQELGLDYIKVDADFIRSLDSGGQDNRTFLEGVVSIAHGMGVTVIAEGVATEQQLVALQNIGFDGATGPHLTQRCAK